MASINKVILIGNLGKDPEIRATANTTVVNFTIATTESWDDKNGAKQKNTEWHRIVAFGKLAEICGKYLNKGKQVYIEGCIQTRKWTDKDGNDKYTTEIVANIMKMLGSKNDDAKPAYSGGGKTAGGGNAKPSYNRRPEPEPEPDDDIPF